MAWPLTDSAGSVLDRWIKIRRTRFKRHFFSVETMTARWLTGGTWPTWQREEEGGGVDRREFTDGEVSGDETGGYVLRATIRIEPWALRGQRRPGRGSSAVRGGGGGRT